MQDAELLRYSRHILLDEIGIEGQQRIRAGHVLQIGAGGLGSPAAMYLAAAGVGRLTVLDDDNVDLTNLQRQIAHTSDSVGQSKVDSLQRTLLALNPGTQVQALSRRADASTLETLLHDVDLVLDCSDNYATRHLVNAACCARGIPLVSGAAVGFDGQISVYQHDAAGTPCYACVFAPEAEAPQLQCATMGVFAPLVGIIGSMQAAQALQLLSGAGTPLRGSLLMLDARSMEWSRLQLQRDPHCSVCGAPRGSLGSAAESPR